MYLVEVHHLLDGLGSVGKLRGAHLGGLLEMVGEVGVDGVEVVEDQHVDSLHVGHLGRIERRVELVAGCGANVHTSETSR